MKHGNRHAARTGVSAAGDEALPSDQIDRPPRHEGQLVHFVLASGNASELGVSVKWAAYDTTLTL